MDIPSRSRGSLKVRAERSYIAKQILLSAQAFIHTEVTSDIVLLIAAVVAIIWANSP